MCVRIIDQFLFCNGDITVFAVMHHVLNELIMPVAMVFVPHYQITSLL